MDRNSNSISRIFLIGIDGGTWNVIDPMLEKGDLPNFRKIIDGGIRGNLRSLEFTASPRVWTSIATGKSEEKHGILDFYNTIEDLKTKRLWDILEQKRQETANIFYWYLTWPPPDDFNGIMVPGFLARDSRTVPKKLSFLKDIEITQKMKLQESYSKLGLFRYLKQAYYAYKYGVKISTMLRILLFFINRKIKNYNELDSFSRLQLIKFYLYTNVFSHLLKTHPTDFSAIMLPQTDQLGHKFWAFMDPEKFEARTGVKVPSREREKYGHVIRNIYSKIDQFIGKVYNLMSDDDLLVILSDHGFGLVTEIGAALKIRSKNFLEVLNLKNAAHCVTIGWNYIIQIDDQQRRSEIEQLAKVIRDIKIVDSNKKLFNVKTSNKEIVLELTNLFLLKIDDANEFLKKKVKVGNQIIDAEHIFINRPDVTGKHEEIGILIMNGKNINKNISIKESHVFDVVPTILYLKNLPVGRDMDGKVITEAIENDFLNRHSIEYIDTYETDEKLGRQDEEDYTMTEELEKRLKDLGYLG